MKCPDCVKEGTRSRLTILGSTATLMGHSPYYDEDGNYHSHDPNRIRTEYNCSRGHSGVMESELSCTYCDWPDRAEVAL